MPMLTIMPSSLLYAFCWNEGPGGVGPPAMMNSLPSDEDSTTFRKLSKHTRVNKSPLPRMFIKHFKTSDEFSTISQSGLPRVLRNLCHCYHPCMGTMMHQGQELEECGSLLKVSNYEEPIATTALTIPMAMPN